jgi:2-hydroxychromene-2-carboxylate isomerase
MSLARSLSPHLTRILTSPRTRDLRRLAAEWRRRLGRQPHRVLYFHQVDDPYSHLAAQVLDRLRERYVVELVPTLVGPPPDAAAPERDRLVDYSRGDAREIAPYYGLEFHDPGRQPDAPLLGLASRILASAQGAQEFAATAVRAGRALWSGDAGALDQIARERRLVETAAVERALAEGDRRRRKLGHYLGAMFYYAGEWYWGIDRLPHLERRLSELGKRRPGAAAGPAVTRRGSATPSTGGRLNGARLRLEFYPSLRSPYSYISFPRVYQLVRRQRVELVLRPVLPMVMRGLPVPAAKRLYIVLDTKREAMEIGMPFGKICDPVGRPVERGFSLFPWAREQGKAEPYLFCFARAAFAEGIDMGSDAGLRKVVESAGLSWAEAQAHLDGQGWRSELEENRRAALGLGLWGVPSFRLIGPEGEPDFCTWGQDRIWLLEQEIARRLSRAGGGSAQSPAGQR